MRRTGASAFELKRATRSPSTALVQKSGIIWCRMARGVSWVVRLSDGIAHHVQVGKTGYAQRIPDSVSAGGFEVE